MPDLLDDQTPTETVVRLRASSSPWRAWPLVVTLEGPDGAGKSTLAAALDEWMVERGIEVRRARSRPRTSQQLRRTEYAHDDPHSTRMRGPVESVARLLLKYAFYLQRWLVETRPTRHPSVLIRERGWSDYEVDGRRYGLTPDTKPLVRALGRLFPRADVVVVLVGDRFAIHERKPDLSTAEIDRVMHEWTQVAPRTAHSTAVINTTSQSPSDALHDLLDWLLDRSEVASPRR